MQQPLTGIRMRYQLLLLTMTNTVVNSGYRMFGAFLPVLARGLGVSPDTLTQLMTLRASIGLVAPLIGSLADTAGRRFGLLLAVGLFIGAMALVAVFPSFAALGLAMMVMGVGKMLYNPSAYAYLGDRVPYQRVGLALGMIEFGWSGAFFIGMPIIGWLIDRFGWQAPFPVLGIIGAVFWLVLWRIIQPDGVHTVKVTSFRKGWHEVWIRRSAVLGLGVGLLLSGSNEMINLVYGRWLEDSYQVKVLELGFTASMLGIAELLGEGLVVLLSDRLGKRRALILGLFPFIGVTLVAPLLGGTLNGALFWLFSFYLLFEYSIVANIPLMADQVPTARATFMAINTGAHWMGRLVSSLLAPLVYTRFGITANALVAVLMVSLALGLLIFVVRENRTRENGRIDL